MGGGLAARPPPATARGPPRPGSSAAGAAAAGAARPARSLRPPSRLATGAGRSGRNPAPPSRSATAWPTGRPSRAATLYSPSFLVDVEVVAPELDQLGRRAGDQRLARQGRRQLAVAAAPCGRPAPGRRPSGRAPPAPWSAPPRGGSPPRPARPRGQAARPSGPAPQLLQLGAPDRHDLVVEARDADLRPGVASVEAELMVNLASSRLNQRRRRTGRAPSARRSRTTSRSQ